MAIYFIIFVILFIVAVGQYKKPNYFLLCPIALFLILFAGLRGANVYNDSLVYQEYYQVMRNSSNIRFSPFVEPSFHLISLLAPNLKILMIIYAFISIPLKIISIKKLSPFVFLSIALLFTHFFLIHEMNQVRAGAAISILLLSIPSILSRRYWSFLFILFIAVLFHYSAIIFLPMYFLNTVKINRIYFYIIPISYIAYYLGVDILSLLSKSNITLLQSKIETYNQLYTEGFYTKINVINPIIILRIILIYFLLFNWKRLSLENPHFVILVKAYVFSIALMVLFAKLPAFGLRIADIFGIVEVILLPYLLFLIREKYFVLSMIFLYGIFLLCLDLLYNRFLNSYTF